MPLVIGTPAAATFFATVPELEARLGRTFTDPAERAQAEALLSDATGHLQALLGQLILPGTSTAVLHLAPCEQWLDLPQYPVRAVTDVKVGRPGQEISTSSYELVNQALYLSHGWWALDETIVGSDYSYGRSGYRRVVVTFDHGLVTVPAELRSWAIVLASQVLAQIGQGGALGSAGLQSERIDDYAVNYATTGDGAAAFNVPPLVAEQLRARYGAGAWVTNSR